VLESPLSLVQPFRFPHYSPLTHHYSVSPWLTDHHSLAVEIMRAEILSLAEDIKQSAGLLRRHL
jgi:hypothetical protein